MRLWLKAANFIGKLNKWVQVQRLSWMRKRSQPVTLPPGSSPEGWQHRRGMWTSGLIWPSHILHFQTRVSWVARISKCVVMKQRERAWNEELGMQRSELVQLLRPCRVSVLSVKLVNCVEWPTRFLTKLLICDSYGLRSTLPFANNINHPRWGTVFWWLCKVSSEGWTWVKQRQEEVYRGLAFVGEDEYTQNPALT